VQIRLEQIAGEVIHRVKRPRVPVRVIMVPTPACKVGSHKTPLERKRTLYWHNAERNNFVAQVARAVHSLDRATLKAAGLRNKDIRVIKKCDRARIRLVVETPEHARELTALLPEWRLGTLSPSPQDAKEMAGETNCEAPVVMTAMYAATHDIRAHIIINAAGTAWPMKVRNFPPMVSQQSPPEVLVIDFDDGPQHGASKDTTNRIKEYERLGMEVHVLQARATGVSARNSSAVIWSSRP
jgi:hypothetical protein